MTLTSCGDTDKKSYGHSQTDSSSIILANDSSSEENIIYEYKSTEELLENEKNKALNGFVAVLDVDDIPEYMKDILIPFKDSSTNLYGYKTLSGDIKISPQFYYAHCFADNKMAYVALPKEWDTNKTGGDFGVAIRPDGSLITNPEKCDVTWVDNDYIKYYDKDFNVHIVDESLNEIDLDSYYGDYKKFPDLDLSENFFGYDDGCSTEVSDKTYLKYINGYLPFVYRNINDNGYGEKAGLLDKNGNIVIEYDGSGIMISCVSNGYYVVLDDFYKGCIFDENFNKVTDSLDFGECRPMESIIYPGGYTYVFMYTADGYEAVVIKIAPELYESE